MHTWCLRSTTAKVCQVANHICFVLPNGCLTVYRPTWPCTVAHECTRLMREPCRLSLPSHLHDVGFDAQPDAQC